MSTKAIQNILISLIFATLIIPFVVLSSTYFPYIFGKAIVFRIIVLVALILWSILIYRDSSFIPSKNKVLLSIGALNCFYLIAAFMGSDLRESIFSGFERMDGWVTTFLVFVFFLISASVMREKKVWNWFFISQICTSLVLFLIGIKELIENGINFRIDATLGNPIYLSVIFLFSIFFALHLLFEDYSKGAQIFFAITIPLNILGVFFSGTRGSILAIFVSGVVVSIMFVVKYWNTKRVKVWSLAVLIFAILVPALLWSFRDSGFVKQNNTLSRLTQINITEGTGYARFINWGIALQGIKERPIIGWGQNSYSYVFDKYYNPKMYAQEPFFDRAHNVILDTAIQGGLLALISYLLIYIFAIMSLFKNVSIRIEQKFILVGLLIAYFIQNLFVFDNLTSYLLFASVLAFSVYYQENKIEKPKKYLHVPVVVIIFSLISFVYFVYLPTVSNLNLIKSIQIYSRDSQGNTSLVQKNGISENKKFFENSLRGNLTGIQEINNASLQAVGSLTRIKTDDEKIKKDTKDYLDSIYKEIVNEAKRKPDSARSQYFAGIFTAQIGDFENAEIFLEEAVNLSPNRQLYLSALAGVKKALKKEDEFLEIVKKIYELETSNDKAWLEYSVELAKRDQKAYLEFLTRSSGEKRIAEAIKVFDSAIERAPDNPQAYVNKGVFLAQIGRIDESVKVFEEVKIRFPESKKQIDEWLVSIRKGVLPN